MERAAVNNYAFEILSQASPLSLSLSLSLSAAKAEET
jgi:hypothetical protein